MSNESHPSTILRKSILVFLDDIVIYSSSLDDHIIHLQQVLELLRKHQLFLKETKCSFAQASWNT